MTGRRFQKIRDNLRLDRIDQAITSELEGKQFITTKLTQGIKEAGAAG
jgi:hypothetical protein